MRPRFPMTALLLAAAAFAATSAPAREPAPPPADGPAATHRGALLVGNKSAASVWRLDLGDGRRVGRSATGEGPHEIAVSPDGRTAVVANYGTGDAAGNTLTVLDLRGGPARTIDLAANTRPHGLRFLPDGTRLVATTEGSEALVVVDVPAGRVEEVIDVGPGLGHMVALSADGATAYVTKLSGGTVVRVDLAAALARTASGREAGDVAAEGAPSRTGRFIREAPAGAGAEGVAVAPDGTVWVGNREDGTVTVHDPGTLEVLATLRSPGFPIRVAFTPDGRHALVTNARAATLAVFDVASRAQVASVDLVPDGVDVHDTLLGRAALPIGAIADPEGGRVFVAISGADRIAVVDATTWKVTEFWETGREPDALGIVAPAGNASD